MYPQQWHPMSHVPGAPQPPPVHPTNMPVSPRQQPATLQQAPATPPSIPPFLPSARLNTGASTFVPAQARIRITDASGHEVSFRRPASTTASPSPPPVSLEETQNRRPPVRIESEEEEKPDEGDEKEVEGADSPSTSHQTKNFVGFVGELFKLKMLTEKIMLCCIKEFLKDIDNPAETDIECLCALVKVIGGSMEKEMANVHIDVYFERMKQISEKEHISFRIKAMLLVRAFWTSSFA